LAFEEEWVRESVLAQPLVRRTAGTHVDPAQLRVQLAVVRERGYALTRDEVREGTASIAVPVFQRGDGAIGAGLGLVTTTDNAATLERHLPALRGIARRIEASVGSFPLQQLRTEPRPPQV